MRNDTKKGEGLLYIILAAGIVFAAILFMVMRPVRETKIETPKKAVKIQKTAQTVYDISKVKKKEAGDSYADTIDFAGMYNSCPETDVGDNMVEGWARMDEKQKAALKGGFEKESAKAQENLNINPEDKHARNKLRIINVLQGMMNEDFNHKFNESAG